MRAAIEAGAERGGGCGHGSCAEQDRRHHSTRTLNKHDRSSQGPTARRAGIYGKRAGRWQTPRNFALRAGEGKTTLVEAAQGAKLSNFGAFTCGHQNYLAGDRWCSHVPGAKLLNFGPHTCGHQRSPARSVGAYTCGPQSYVTLLLTRHITISESGPLSTEVSGSGGGPHWHWQWFGSARTV